MSNQAWLNAKREANDRERRAIAFADEANRLLRECEGSAVTFDSEGNVSLTPSESYDYHARRGLICVPSNRGRTGSRFAASTPRTRTIGVAPGSTEPTASLRVTYADGTSEIRSHSEFRRNPTRQTPSVTRAPETAKRGGSQS